MTCRGDQLGMEFSPEEIRACRERDGLLSIELELSRLCNLRCIYCYASSGEPLENEMSLAEIFRVINQAVALGVRKVIVLGGGEPLVYPHLFEVLDYLRGKNLRIDLFTNGISMTREKARKLRQLEIGVILKMNSRMPEIQDYLAGKDGAYKAIMKGLDALQEEGYPNESCLLGIETIICRQNYEELPDLWRWARRRGIVPYFEIMTSQGRATQHDDLSVDQEKIRVLFEELARIDRDEFECSWQPHPPLVASHCARHEYSCTITSNGDIHPCPGVDVVAGSIRRNSLAEIIRSSKVVQELRDIRNTIKGQCGLCELHLQCYGCRGHAYQVAGDYLAEDPICWLKNNQEESSLEQTVACRPGAGKHEP